MGIFDRLRAGRAFRPQGKAGARAYAVGDVHGRLDLLDLLLDRIEADVASRPEKRTYIVFLGDLIDRGPESAAVIERLRTYAPGFATPVFIAGNHEEILLRILHGELDILSDWLKFGGAECLESYGVDAASLRRLEPRMVLDRLKAAVPASHLEFIESFADTFRFGDYLFVHAGIRPGIEVAAQDQFDLRWIREPFLSHDEQHGLLVVHGHTIVPVVEERANRIGIDTGAYRSGILTAIAIEDDQRWYLASDLSAGSAVPAPEPAGETR